MKLTREKILMGARIIVRLLERKKKKIVPCFKLQWKIEAPDSNFLTSLGGLKFL